MSIHQQFTSAGGQLLSALDSIRNLPALGLQLATLVGAALLWGLGVYLGVQWHPLFGMLFALAGLVVAFYGLNAVGILLMDEAQGGTSRSVSAAVLRALAIGHRLLLVGLMVGVLWLGGMIVLAIVLLICKIPVLGPVLFTFVFPVSVLLSGIAFFALSFVVLPIAAPAVWAGATAMQALAQVAAVVRSRLINVLVMMLLLFFLTAVVGGFIGMILASGTLLTASLAAPILGAGAMASLGGIAGLASGGGSGHMVAGFIGAGVLYAVAFSLPTLIYVRGFCQVYLANIEGLDSTAMEDEMRNRVDAARQRAQNLRERTAPAQTAQPTQPAQAVPTPPVAPPPAAERAATLRCPACAEPHLQSDLFCAGCGQALG